jgi:hypothetical protein
VLAARPAVVAEHRVAQRLADLQLGALAAQGAVDDVAAVVAVELAVPSGVLHRQVHVVQRLQQESPEELVGTPDEHELRFGGSCDLAGSKPWRDRALRAPAHSETATTSSQPVDLAWSAALPPSRTPSNIQ